MRFHPSFEKEGIPAFILNDAYAKVYGYDSAEEIIGGSWHMLYYPDELKRFKSTIMPVLYNSGKWQGEAVGKKKDGSTFPQELSLTILSDGCLICVVRDITARKKTENDLYDKIVFQQTLIDAIPTPIFYKDKNGIYQGCNVEFEKFWNVSSDAILGKSADNFLTESIAKKEEATDKMVLKKMAAVTYEEIVKAKNGANKRLIVKKAIYIKCDGTVGGIVGFMNDVTPLKESEERYKLFVENSNDGIAIVENNIHVYANKKFANIFGYDSAGDVIGKGFEFVIHEKDVERVKMYTLLRKKGKSAENHYIVCGVKKNGDTIYVDISVSMVKYNGLPSSLAFVRDVTDRILYQKELKKAEELYRTVMENTGTGIVIVDEDMTIVTVNDKFVHISGYARKEDIQGKMLWKDFFDESVVGFMETYHVARRNNGESSAVPKQYVSVFVDKHGNKRNVLLSVDIIPNTKKSVISVIVMPDQPLLPMR